jgi:Tol biopolymer transport system component
MKTTHLTFPTLGLCILLCVTSCAPSSYLMTSAGETFDALSKITDSDKPCINPNGGDNDSNIVFSSRSEDGAYNIYMKDNVLSKAMIKKTDGNNFNLSPSICKVTHKIAFQYFDKFNFDIYYIDAMRGKAITQVTYTDENEYNPSWSENGKLIIFEKGSPPRLFITVTKSTLKAAEYTGIAVTKNQIWLKNLETGELKMLGEGSFPVISPDGTKIAFVKYDLNKQKTEETGTLWIMSNNGDSPKQITNNQVGYASHPNWNPEGDKLVFHLTKKNKKDADIYTIDVDGENLMQHTTNESNDFSPYWSKDNYIYFSSDRGSKKGNFQIWRFKISK